ncbi:MAG TPA: chain length determinant protein EpsF [Noviherbaspirillum sp.]
MNTSQLLLILQARRTVILMTLLVTVLATLVTSLLMPRTYKATSTLVLNYKGVDPVTGLTLPSQLMPGYMATQVDVISSRSVARNVVEQLKLAEDEEIKASFADEARPGVDIRDWLAEALLKRLTVEPSRESGVIGISYKASDPQKAAAIANAFAAEYQKTSIQLKAEPLRKVSAYFTQQVTVLRDNLEAAQSKLSKAQQEKGIVNIDSRLDVESARLNDLSNQLVSIQARLAEARSRRQQVSGREREDSPDVVGNPLVQTLKASIVTAEAKLAQMGENVTPDYPPYVAAKAELGRLRAELNRHIRSVSNSVGNNAAVLERQEEDVRSALLAQRNKVLELNRERDQLSVLARDVESAQRAYDATMQRFNQTNLEGQANQTDVSVLTMATPPLSMHSPRILLNILLSVFLGTMLGIGFGLLAEKIDPRVRSENDLMTVLQAPVLGTIRWNMPAPRRIGFPGWLLPHNAH